MANRLGMVLKLTEWSIFSKKPIDISRRRVYYFLG